LVPAVPLASLPPICFGPHPFRCFFPRCPAGANPLVSGQAGFQQPCPTSPPLGLLLTYRPHITTGLPVSITTSAPTFKKLSTRAQPAFPQHSPIPCPGSHSGPPTRPLPFCLLCFPRFFCLRSTRDGGGPVHGFTWPHITVYPKSPPATKRPSTKDPPKKLFLPLVSGA